MVVSTAAIFLGLFHFSTRWEHDCRESPAVKAAAKRIGTEKRFIVNLSFIVS